MAGYSQGKFEPTNPQKYVGKRPIIYRSSWELKFMTNLDQHPSVTKWASESIQIPYINPMRPDRVSHYVPDFMIQYIDSSGKQYVELLEIKPASQTTLESAGRSASNQMAVAVNTAKWAAAQEWCAQQGIRFRVLNEQDLYHTKKARNPKKRVTKKRRK